MKKSRLKVKTMHLWQQGEHTDPTSGLTVHSWAGKQKLQTISVSWGKHLLQQILITNRNSIIKYTPTVSNSCSIVVNISGMMWIQMNTVYRVCKNVWLGATFKCSWSYTQTPVHTFGFNWYQECINLIINAAGITQQVERGGFLRNKGWRKEGGSFPLRFKRELKYMYLSGSCNKTKRVKRCRRGNKYERQWRMEARWWSTTGGLDEIISL